MPKKQKVKKLKIPKAPRVSRVSGSKKIGPKDKSIKQNVNVNVTSSGGSGSGGSSIPSSQPYYNPMVNAMRQGEREGENIQLKKLTDLLTKSIAPKAPALAPIPAISPLFEGEEINVDYQVKRKPDLENKTLLERVNTKNINDIEAIVNNNDINDEAQLINNNNLVVENEEVSKSVGDGPEFEENIVDAENFFSIVPKIIKDNKNVINQVIGQTFDYYSEIGKDEPLLYDDLNEYNFKIIDGVVVPWSKIESRGPLKEYSKKIVQSHYSASPKELNNISNDTIINYGKIPNSYQSDLLNDYYLEQEAIKEAKANLKKAKAKKGKKTDIEL